VNHGSVSDPEIASLPRRERDRLQRRFDILAAAERVMAQKGYEDASIEEIARAAEYGTGTVYLYFKDKETLYVELVGEKFRRMIGHVQQRVKEETDPIEGLRRLIHARMEFFDENRAFFRIYMGARTELGLAKGRRWEGIAALRECYVSLITRLIRAGQRQGAIRRGDPRQFAIALTGMMRQLTRDWLRSENGRPLTGSVEFVLDLFLNGAKAQR
jgi:AcrR family transcriptional regulator